MSSLVVIADNDLNNRLRMTLKSLGFAKIISLNSHTQALQRLKSLSFERRFSFVLYDAKDTDMPAVEFTQRALEEDPNGILVSVSSAPNIDDVFGQLKSGARGFLVVPFTADGLESVIYRAQEGPPFSESVLRAPDRNTALVGGILNSLYRLSVLKRQIREYPHIAKDLPRYHRSLAESAELALLFCEGGDEDALRERIVDECLARATAAASRLGRTRQKLTKKREKSKTNDETDEKD